VTYPFTRGRIDTTASTLTSMIKMLGENPDADHKLCQEIHEELMPTDEAYPSFDLLVKKGGKYLDGVVNEVLRLQPPVPIDNKLCLESCVLPGTYFSRLEMCSFSNMSALFQMALLWRQVPVYFIALISWVVKNPIGDQMFFASNLSDG